MWPWKNPLLTWAPFKIDALGLVTLLGAEEVNASVGRLLRSRYLEYLPLLGAYMIAGDRFREKDTGFNLYNISEGIHTTDLAAWYTRWIRSIEPKPTRTYVLWSVIDPWPEVNGGQQDTADEAKRVHQREIWDNIIAFTINFVFTGFLIAGSLLSKDWYGFANAIAMTVSTFVRWWTISTNRQAIDHAVLTTAIKSRKAHKKAIAEDPDGEPPEILKRVKTLVITSDSRCVTNIVPNDLIIPVFTRNPEIRDKAKVAYDFVRWLGWLAFAVHVVSIGMADLATQLYTVVLLVVPTVMYVKKVGCDDSEWWTKTTEHLFGLEPRLPQQTLGPLQLKKSCFIGRYLKADICEWPSSYDLNPGTEKRRDLYTYLWLNRQETESMDKWDLFPHRRTNTEDWWLGYKQNRENLKPHLREGVALYKPGPDDIDEGRPVTVPLSCDVDGLPENVLLTASVRTGPDGNYIVDDARIIDPSRFGNQTAAGSLTLGGGTTQSPGTGSQSPTFSAPVRSNTGSSGIIPGPMNSAYPASGATPSPTAQPGGPASSSGMSAIQ